MSSRLQPSLVSLLAPILVAIVECAVVAPLLALLDAAADRDHLSRSPNVVVLGLIGLVAFSLTRWLQRRAVSLRAIQLVLLGGVAALAVVAPLIQGLGTLWSPDATGVVVLAAIAASLAWWRGMQYGSDPEPFGADRLSALVKVGWVALVIQVLIVASIDSDRADAAADALRIAMPVAVVAGLVLLTLGQIEQARINAIRRGGRPPERRGWLTYAVVFAVGLLVLAILGSAVLGDTADWILKPLAWLIDGLVFVLTWVLYGAVYVIFILLYPVIWLLEKIRPEPQEQQQQQQGETGPLEQIVNDGADGLPAALQTAIEIGAVVLLITLVLIALVVTMRRVRPQPDVDDSDEERESLWSRDLAMSQLKGFFRRGHGDGAERIDLRQPPRSVREAYRALQALAQRDGIPRRDAETPAEFGVRLAAAWPGEATAIADLTRRYERVRYAEAPDEPGLAAARQAWSEILRTRTAL